MRDERGVTLIELLVAIVILGIVLIPLLTIMTGTSIRTASNEKGSSNLYLAQGVVEKVRINSGVYKVHLNVDGSDRAYCASKVIGICDSYESLDPTFDSELNLKANQMVELTVSEMSAHPSFNEVKVVTANVQVDGEGIIEKKNVIEFVTVVKQ